MKFTPKQKQVVIKMRKQLTNEQLFTHLVENFNYTSKFTTFRTQLYKIGLKKCDILRWTKKETQLLLDNYQTKGNIEIAKMLTTRTRKFGKKNIEKKMILLNLSRTTEQLQNIINNHKRKGTYHKANIKRWNNKRVEEGDTKVQVINGRPQVSIKVNGALKAYARHRYIELHGEIPKEVKIYFKDMNPLNVADNNLVARQGRGLSSEEHNLYKANCKAYFESLSKGNKSTEKNIVLPDEKPSKGLIGVRINRRTVLYVAPGTNIDQLKERYAINN